MASQALELVFDWSSFESSLTCRQALELVFDWLSFESSLTCRWCYYLNVYISHMVWHTLVVFLGAFCPCHRGLLSWGLLCKMEALTYFYICSASSGDLLDSWGRLGTVLTAHKYGCPSGRNPVRIWGALSVVINVSFCFIGLFLWSLSEVKSRHV